MKVICLQENLKFILNITQNIIGRNLTLPILNNVLLQTENGRLKISSTNLEVGINTWVSGKVEKNGVITCPAKVLANFVNNLPNKKVELEVKNNTLTIKCENYKANLNGLPADDFPIIPKIEEDPLVELKSGVLRDALLKVVGAASLSESRPEITGILFKFDKRELKLAATDSFRLAEKIIFETNKKSEDVKSLIIPQKTVQEIIRALGEKETDVRICLSASQILFDGGDIQVISRLIDGQYPDYQQIIPKNFSTQATIDRSELLSIIKVAAVFSNKTNSINFSLNNNELEVLSQDPELGENKSKIAAKIQGKKIEANFNYRYLLDGLANIGTKQVFLGLNSDSSPAIIKPIGDESYVYLIMPIKAN
ncbi:MAG: DNA polymerase III subunit beta [Candidatus Portnoybacteria bacterium]|nr:DNA polymerase III subunit beta [Candidatus Portnoybacteria bacterium]MDD4982710.1 DNA polymerase III subunit beta [Candidatus Portnoybacteria bacterium]